MCSTHHYINFVCNQCQQDFLGRIVSRKSKASKVLKSQFKLKNKQVNKQTNKYAKPLQIQNSYAGAARAMLIAVFILYVTNDKSTILSGVHVLK